MIGPQDTIAALSSPPGRAPRGLVRFSGPAVRHILAQLIKSARGDSNPQLDGLTPRQVTPCRVFLSAPATRQPIANPTPSDEDHWPLPALVVYFPGPNSYTGQDLAEIQAPGHPALLDRLLQQVVALGARLAEPGEFTYRAFLAGKLDLTEAEGVAATIAATSDRQLEAASTLRQGLLGRLSAQWIDQLAHLLALVEAGIDFTDQDDVTPIGPQPLDEQLAALQNQLEDLLAHCRSWGQIESLPLVVLVGPPSVGKSTLFNALLGRQRSVISPTPGTTRDVLMETFTLPADGGRLLEVQLADLAGLDDAATALDRAVQEAARATINRADLLLLIDDGSKRSLCESQHFSRWVKTPVVRVRSKVDLACPANRNDLDPAIPGFDVAVSGRTGRGLAALRSLIVSRLADRLDSSSGQGMALQPRHELALSTARTWLRQARDLLAGQRDSNRLSEPELIANALRGALDELEGLAGRVSRDDVIGKVFATFCVGK